MSSWDAQAQKNNQGGGSCVMRIDDSMLYAMNLDGVANCDFDAVVREFDQLAASAQLRK
jgi:hypothetical protein